MKLTAKNLLDALGGKLNANDVADLTRELQSLPHEEVLGVAGEARISIDGDGNIIGNNNVSVVIKGDNSQALAESLRQHLERGRSLHQLRAPVSDFVGRNYELRLFTEALHGGGKTVCVSGMAGVGKTELALLAADAVRVDYPDAHLFIELGGSGPQPIGTSEALITCIRALRGKTVELPTGIDELAKLYRSALSGKRALILADDALDGEQVQPLAPPSGSALLITSRNRMILPGIVLISLEQLSPTDAQELLHKIEPRVSQELSHQICRLCGYLPLAVRTAASLLAVTVDLDPAYYISQLEDERTRLERLREMGGSLDVKASLNLSYNRLPPDIARIFRLLSVFPYSFDSSAEEIICEDQGHVHLSELVRRNLALFDGALGRYRLHDLVKIFAAGLVQQEERAAALRLHAKYYLSITTKAASIYIKGGGNIARSLSLFDSEWENIRAGQAWAAEQAGKHDEAAELCIKYPWHGWIVLSLRQPPRARVRWVKQALTSALRLGDRYAEGACYSLLGSAYSAMGEIRTSIKFTKKYLDITRELSKRDDEGGALKSLGRSLQDLGKYRSAIICFEHALRITREVGDLRTQTSVLLYLGQSCAALGNGEKALDLYEQALVLARETGNLWNQAAILGGIGNLHLSHGGDCALPYFEETLKIFRDIGNREGEASALHSIGSVLTQTGRPNNALEYLRQALEINLEFGNQIGISKTYGDIGLAYSEMHDHHSAIDFYERQLDIATQIGDMQSQADCLGNMAASYQALGELARAIMLREQSLTLFRGMGSKPRICSTLGALGRLYGLQGEISRSLGLHEQRIALADELGHYECLAESHYDRSLGLRERGEFTEAIESAERALAIYERIAPDKVNNVREMMAQWKNATPDE